MSLQSRHLPMEGRIAAMDASERAYEAISVNVKTAKWAQLLLQEAPANAWGRSPDRATLPRAGNRKEAHRKQKEGNKSIPSSVKTM